MVEKHCEALSNGNVEIRASGSMTPSDAAQLIVEIAKTAIQAQRRSGQALPDGTMEVSVPHVETTAMGLDPTNPGHGYILLSLFFGVAQVGIAIAKSDGMQLGPPLIAACSDETTSH
jgi:hypothetical protein